MDNLAVRVSSEELDQFITSFYQNGNAVQKSRDLSIIHLLNGITLVIACDSNASNGEKELDTHPNSVQEVAVSALKVPLMEVIASGAKPLVIVNNLCVEMNSYGKRIIDQMRMELARCGLLERVQLTGSTEDNMLTRQTGIGVTVIGIVQTDKLRAGTSQPGDVVVCIGIPQSGIDVPYSEFSADVAKIDTVLRLDSLNYVHEILPIGSKGVRYEAIELARVAGLRFEESKTTANIDFTCSAGASTAVLVSIESTLLPELKSCMELPCHVVGTLKAN